MKTVLITGGSGFLADKIFTSLLNTNNYHPVLATRNTSKLLTLNIYKAEQVRTFDISNPSTYRAALSGVDAVIHLAAMDFQACEKDPDLAWKVNVEQVKELIEKCHECHVTEFIYFSTIHVYGPGLSGIISEETPTNPVNNYAKTHLAAEKIVLDNGKIAGKIIRLSNAIGKPIHSDANAWNLVVNDLCKQVVTTKKMVLNSSGLQLRDFIPAPSIGEAIRLLLGSKGSAELPIYNLGGGKSFSMLEIAAIIQNESYGIFGFKPELHTKPAQNEKICVFNYSISKLRRLGFNSSLRVEVEINNILRGMAADLK